MAPITRKPRNNEKELSPLSQSPGGPIGTLVDEHQHTTAGRRKDEE